MLLIQNSLTDVLKIYNFPIKCVMKSPFLPGHLEVNHNWHRPVSSSLGALYNVHNIQLGNIYNTSFLMPYVIHTQ